MKNYKKEGKVGLSSLLFLSLIIVACTSSNEESTTQNFGSPKVEEIAESAVNLRPFPNIPVAYAIFKVKPKKRISP